MPLGGNVTLNLQWGCKGMLSGCLPVVCDFEVLTAHRTRFELHRLASDGATSLWVTAMHQHSPVAGTWKAPKDAQRTYATWQVARGEPKVYLFIFIFYMRQYHDCIIFFFNPSPAWRPPRRACRCQCECALTLGHRRTGCWRASCLRSMCACGERIRTAARHDIIQVHDLNANIKWE